MKVDFKITEILTLPITIMAALSLASGIILFSPTAFLDRLFMFEFREKNGFIIGIVFVVSVSILIVNLIYSISKSIVNAKQQKRFYANAEKRLKKLDNYQKAIVYKLFKEDNRTALLPLHDGSVSILEQNYIIGKATTQYMVEDLNNALFPYLLQPWVLNELDSKPDLSSEFRIAFEFQCQKEFNTIAENDNSYPW